MFLHNFPMTAPVDTPGYRQLTQPLQLSSTEPRLLAVRVAAQTSPASAAWRALSLSARRSGEALGGKVQESSTRRKRTMKRSGEQDLRRQFFDFFEGSFCWFGFMRKEKEPWKLGKETTWLDLYKLLKSDEWQQNFGLKAWRRPTNHRRTLPKTHQKQPLFSNWSSQSASHQTKAISMGGPWAQSWSSHWANWSNLLLETWLWFIHIYKYYTFESVKHCGRRNENQTLEQTYPPAVPSP